MKVMILGTSAAEGWPAPFCRCDNCTGARKAAGKNVRTRSCMLVNGKTMVDFPPDVLYHCNRRRIDIYELEHLLITHPHSDHLYATELLWRRKHFSHPWDERVLHVYGCEQTRRIIDAAIDGQWDECRLDFHPLTRWQSFQLNELGKVTAVHADHAANFECFNYLLEAHFADSSTNVLF